MDANQPAKLGRNSSCACGSGKKYKKCCLNNKQALINSSMDRLKKNTSDKTIFVSPEEIGVRKMSEIILEYADEFLALTDTKREKEDVIELAIAAWNIAIADKNKRFSLIDNLVSDVWEIERNSNHWEKIVSVLLILINKKLQEYPSIDRPILDYDFIKLNSDEYHLNVVSGVAVS